MAFLIPSWGFISYDSFQMQFEPPSLCKNRRLCSETHIVLKLNYLKNILFCSGYSINLLESIIGKRFEKVEKDTSAP